MGWRRQQDIVHAKQPLLNYFRIGTLNINTTEMQKGMCID